MLSIKPFQERQDGRTAFLVVESHNYGPGKWDNVVKNAKHVVLTSKFDNANARNPVSCHIINQRDAHNDMICASEAENYTYQVPNDHTRVQGLFHSIKSKYTSVITAKARLLTDPNLENDFEAAAEHLIHLCPPANPASPSS